MMNVRWNLKYLNVLNGVLALILVLLLVLIRVTGAESPPSIPEPGELLYATTFDDFNDEWGLYGGQKSAEVVDGQLQISIGKSNDGSFSPIDRQFSDFDMTVESTQLAGADDNTGYGMVFRHQDERHHYYFLISGDGYYIVTLVNAGEAKNLTADWRPSEYINQGNATNMMRVVGRGDTFTFYINGHQLTDLCLGERVTAFNCGGGELSDVLTDSTFEYGRVGVAALSLYDPDVLIGFDNMVIVGPEAEG